MGMGDSIQGGGDWGEEVAFVHRVSLLCGDGRHGSFDFESDHRVRFSADGAVEAGGAEVMCGAQRIGDGHWPGLERGAATRAIHTPLASIYAVQFRNVVGDVIAHSQQREEIAA